jgi:glycosyltransferase involved in cell wall biosynthesis
MASGAVGDIRVLSVIHSPDYAGAHNQLLRLRDPLRDRGVELIAALPAEGGPAAERMRAGGVEVHAIPLARLRATARPDTQARFLATARRDVARLADLAGEVGANAVQVHGVQNPQAAFAARRRGAAVAWQLLDTRAPMPLRRACMPMVTRMSDSVSSWGVAVAEGHPGARRLGDRLVTVFPPVDTAAFAPDEGARRRARERLGVEPGRVLVGTVGVRYPPKGHIDLVRAAAVVAPQRPDATFRIIGAPSPSHPDLDAKLLAEARRLGLRAGEDIDLFDPGADVAELVQAIDVFVMTSPRRSEGMPTAILEAMVAGKPVIATDAGATRELVEDAVTGVLTEPGRPDQTAAAILRLLGDEGLREELGAAGRLRALGSFDLATLADRHREAFEIAMEHRRQRRRR